MQGTVILPCLCPHEDQDKMYGKGRRVHNVTPKGDAFCTVCTPRALPCDKVSQTVEPAPIFGMLVRIPARRFGTPKKIAQN